MNKAEQVHFFKRLSFLIGAQVPILESLYILHEQTTVLKHKRLLKKIAKDVSEGQSLSRSFGKYPRQFNPFSLSMLSVAEESGTLPANLAYLSEELQKRYALKRKLVAASIYPGVIACATLGITTFLLLYLFPKITPLFASLHAELPFSTRVVMASSSFVEHWGLFTLCLCTVFVLVGISAVKKSVLLRLYFDRFLLRVPLVGSIARSYNLSTASRTLGLLLKGGMQFSQALVLTGTTTINRAYHEEFQKLSLVVEGGSRASSYVQRNAYFPPLYGHMIAVGEKSGTLSDTCLYLADFYATEVDEYAKSLSSLVEPVMMIVIGMLVGFIAVSIIAPLYGITQNLHA